MIRTYFWLRLCSLRVADTLLVELISGLWFLCYALQGLSAAAALSPSYRALFSLGYPNTVKFILVVVGICQLAAALFASSRTRRITSVVATSLWVFMVSVVYLSVGFVPFVWQSGLLGITMILASIRDS